MSGENCLITIAQFGKVRVKAERVTHGMSIVEYSSSGQTRRYRAFYPSKRTSGSFELDLVFTTFRGYKKFAEWLERYSRHASNPRTATNAARVVIPSRKFDKVGVLESGITYGDRVGATSYRMQLAFVGSRSPVEVSNQTASRFVLPAAKKKDKALPYLYPAGTQLSGNDRGEDTIWDLGLDELIDTHDNIGGGGDSLPDDWDPPGGAAPAGA